MTYPIRIPNELVDHWRDLYESEGHMPEWLVWAEAADGAPPSWRHVGVVGLLFLRPR
jgi:hypothetical protein